MQTLVANPSKPILVVEDSDLDFVCLQKIMTKLSVTNPIYRCTDGDEAIDFLCSQKHDDSNSLPLPAIILLDLNLPGTNGKEVLRKVKQDELLKTNPIVIFKKYNDPQDIN